MLDKKDLKAIKDIVGDGLNDVAEVVNQGFNELEGKMNKQNKRFDKLEAGQKALKQGQENIELRLTNVAYRFELQELEQRIKVLEVKVGVKQ